MSHTVGREIFAVNKIFAAFREINLHLKVLARGSNEIFAVITSNCENKNRGIFE